MLGDHFLLIGCGFCGGINLADAKTGQLTIECLRNVRGGIGSAEMHGMTALRKPHRNGGGDGGFSYATLAHRHDYAFAIFLNAFEQCAKGGHVGHRPLHIGLGDFP